MTAGTLHFTNSSHDFWTSIQLIFLCLATVFERATLSRQTETISPEGWLVYTPADLSVGEPLQ